jgi:LPS export ABC transporter protein LptC
LMKRLVKNLLAGVTIALVYIMGRNNFQSPTITNVASPSRHSATIPQADLVIKGLNLTETKDDALLWKIKADSAQIYQEQGTARLNNIKLTIFENKQPVLWLEGKVADMNINKRDITVTGKVVANFRDDLLFETNSLTWQNEERMLSTSTPIKISRPHLEIQGQGLQADVDSEKLSINNGVTTVID